MRLVPLAAALSVFTATGFVCGEEATADRLVPDAPAMLAVGAGPSLLLGGHLPNIVSAGGGARIGDREPGGGLWFFGSYHETISPATVYGLSIEGVQAALGVDFVRSSLPLGFVMGFAFTRTAYFNHRPGGPRIHGGSNWFHARFGFDGVFHVRGRLSIRVAAIVQIPHDVHTIIVDRRESQRWSSVPISGVFSVEVLADLVKIPNRLFVD